MSKITIVAEVACAHEGNTKSLLNMIKAAAKAGVDIIQFQFFQIEENAIPGQSCFDLGKRLEIPIEMYNEIFKYSKELDLKVWATVGDVISAKEAYKYTPDMWRVHSSDINNISLIKYLCQTRIPLSLAVGGSTLKEIEYAIDYIKENGGEIKALIHGFQGYPTPVDEVNLSFIKTLKKRFGIVVGYQDHTDGEDPLGFIIPAMAICCGAEIIEKHFTLDRSKKGVDYHASLNPDELIKFVRLIRRANAAKGCVNCRSFGEAEQRYRKTFKKGLVFKRDIVAGDKIESQDLKMVRAENLKVFGTQIKEILGRKLKTDVAQNQVVEWRFVE